MIELLLTEGGRRRAGWILKMFGFDVDFEVEEPIVEDRGLTDSELDMFDEIETLLYSDMYEDAYALGVGVVRELVLRGRYESALYVCHMIGDETLRREVLKEGMRFYESRGDFGRAMKFAEELGDTKRREIYRRLYEMYLEIKRRDAVSSSNRRADSPP